MDPRRSINSKHKKHYIKANHVTLFKTSGKEKTLKAAKGKGKKKSEPRQEWYQDFLSRKNVNEMTVEQHQSSS